MKKLKVFVIYFPVILVSCQVLVNLLYFIDRDFYMTKGFYLNHFFGSNLGVSIFFLIFTFTLNFCAVSRWAAVAEFLFALNYLIIQQDNLYNIMFQVIVGTVAIIATFTHFIKRFPLCKVSLFSRLLWNLFTSYLLSGSCISGYEKWEESTKQIISKKYFNDAD